jgi:hypothetical protein
MTTLTDIARRELRILIATSLIWLLVFNLTSNNVFAASVVVSGFACFMVLYLFQVFLKGRFFVGPKSKKMRNVQLWMLMFAALIPSTLYSIDSMEIVSVLILIFILVFSVAQSKRLRLFKSVIVVALLGESLILGLVIYLMVNWQTVMILFQKILKDLRILFNTV